MAYTGLIMKGCTKLADGAMEKMGVAKSDRKIVTGTMSLAGLGLSIVTFDPAGGLTNLADAADAADAADTLTELISRI